MNLNDITDLNKILCKLTAEEVIRFLLKEYEGRIIFSTGLGAEDQVLTHMISGINKNTQIFTLDTGRLFQETYELLQITESKYDIKIKVYFPESDAVEKMVNKKGINLFYESIENRKHCCHIRKIEPLTRALSKADAWICGLRNEQTSTRSNLDIVEWDEQHEIIKISPIISWTHGEVWDYIKKNNIPYNRLHDKGYPSIGCQPCTRAVNPGDSNRAGRWWWEMDGNKECGLHIN